MPDFFMLEQGQWAGLTNVPTTSAGMASSPVLITSVMPIKTGHGDLRVDLVQPFHVGGSRSLSFGVKVVQKSRSHITCLMDDGGDKSTVIFARPDFDWLTLNCGPLMRRRPPSGPVFIVDGEEIGNPTWHEYLSQVFGEDETSALSGATKNSFKVKLPKMPAQRASIMVNKEFEQLDACLIARGFCPQQMEDKWFVYYESGRILFRRSWTGILIYDVEAYWRGDRLYLGQAWVNRKTGQYSETNDRHDEHLLQYIIDVVLRGVPATFPAQPDSDQSALEAWSLVGSASIG